MGLVYDEWISESTKSGMNTGLEITTPEKVGEFLGLQNTNTIDFWNQISKNSLGDKEIRQEARDFKEKSIKQMVINQWIYLNLEI